MTKLILGTSDNNNNNNKATTRRAPVGHKGRGERKLPLTLCALLRMEGRRLWFSSSSSCSPLCLICRLRLIDTNSRHHHHHRSYAKFRQRLDSTRLDYSVLGAWKLEMTFAAASCHFLLLRACYWSSSSDVLIYSAAAAERQDHTSPQVVDRHFHSPPPQSLIIPLIRNLLALLIECDSLFHSRRRWQKWGDMSRGLRERETIQTCQGRGHHNDIVRNVSAAAVAATSAATWAHCCYTWTILCNS